MASQSDDAKNLKEHKGHKDDLLEGPWRLDAGRVAIKFRIFTVKD